MGGLLKFLALLNPTDFRLNRQLMTKVSIYHLNGNITYKYIINKTTETTSKLKIIYYDLLKYEISVINIFKIRIPFVVKIRQYSRASDFQSSIAMLTLIYFF